MILLYVICCIDRDILGSVLNLHSTDFRRLHGLLVGREDPIDYIKFLRTSGLVTDDIFYQKAHAPPVRTRAIGVPLSSRASPPSDASAEVMNDLRAMMRRSGVGQPRGTPGTGASPLQRDYRGDAIAPARLSVVSNVADRLGRASARINSLVARIGHLEKQRDEQVQY